MELSESMRIPDEGGAKVGPSGPGRGLYAGGGGRGEWYVAAFSGQFTSNLFRPPFLISES